MAPPVGPENRPEPEIRAPNGGHHETIRNVREKLPDTTRLNDLAEFFKIFGDRSRVTIIWALGESEMCVQDLCMALDMKQSAMSHQLKTLRQARVVKSRRDGKNVYYSLDDDHIRKLINFGMEHLDE
jgi:ArsR family transcriptional regulator, lead/cadmium/zinc/bismuth-responsive transcriptional repressor